MGTFKEKLTANVSRRGFLKGAVVSTTGTLAATASAAPYSSFGVLSEGIDKKNKEKKTKRALIMYFTITGNTTKVVNRFQEVFKKRGWECDVLKIDRKTDLGQSPSLLDVSKYDFFCFGSGNYKNRPGDEIIDMMRNNPADIHYNPSIVNQKPPVGVAGQYGLNAAPGQELEAPAPAPKPSGSSSALVGHNRIYVTPEWKKAIAFLTFAGGEFGWAEAEPSLAALELEMAHMRLDCIGKFSCPGKFGGENPNGYFKDLHTRPNERDLLSAEIFLERALDSIE